MVVHFSTKKLWTNIFGYVHMCTKFLCHVHMRMIGEHKKAWTFILFLES